MSAFDFRSDGPPQPVCDLCGQQFKAWQVPDEKWNLLPEKHRRQELCVKDYHRLLRESGQDPKGISISYKPWRYTREVWKQKAGQAPPNYVQIRFPHPDEPEIMWCEVLSQRIAGYVVRLLNNSFLDEAIEKGSLFLARWDQQTVHGLTGRPVFQPIRRLHSFTRS